MHPSVSRTSISSLSHSTLNIPLPNSVLGPKLTNFSMCHSDDISNVKCKYLSEAVPEKRKPKEAHLASPNAFNNKDPPLQLLPHNDLDLPVTADDGDSHAYKNVCCSAGKRPKEIAPQIFRTVRKVCLPSANLLANLLAKKEHLSERQK